MDPRGRETNPSITMGSYSRPRQFQQQQQSQHFSSPIRSNEQSGHVAESFLAMEPGSSSSPSSTKATSASSSTMLMSLSTSSSGAEMGNGQRKGLAHSMNFASSSRHSPPPLAGESEQESSTAAGPSRPKANSRGTRLGMQMGKMKVSSPSYANQSPVENNNIQQNYVSENSPSRKGMTRDTSGSSLSSNHATYDSNSRLNDVSTMSEDTLNKSTTSKPQADQSPNQQTFNKPGQLSDATIAKLYATPGTDPSALLNSDGQPLSSKNILTIALQKAQSAVLLDGSNNVPEAITAYKQAVRLLQEVMERVSPKNANSSNSSRSRKVHREEERRRLKVIHDTYAERIRLLSMISSPDPDESNESTFVNYNADTSGEADNEEEDVEDSIDTSRLGQNVGRNEAEQISTPRNAAAPIINISHDDSFDDHALNDRGDEEESHLRLRKQRLDDETLMTPATPYFDADTTFEGARMESPYEDQQTLARMKGVESNTLTVGQPHRPQREQILVSPTTSTGTISQRRRNANASAAATATAFPSSQPPESSPMSLQSVFGSESQSVTPTLASVASMISTGNTPPIPPIAGSEEAEVNSVIPSNWNKRQNEREAIAAAATSRLPPPMSDEEFANRERDRKASNSSVRKRATSQPSNRRPSIPASFLSGASRANASATPPPVPPPMPRITRKASMPLSLLPQASSNGPLGIAGALPSPAPSSYSGYHMLGTPITALPTASLVDDKSLILQDLFPNALPSMQMGMQPTFSSNSAALGLSWLGVTNSLNENIASQESMPQERCLRPFYTMRQLRTSIERGSFVTQKLFLPRELWLQSGSRLSAVETKIRMMDLVNVSIENVEQAGSFLLRDPSWHQPGTTAIHVAKFVKQLDEVEVVMGEVQSTLNKKLGDSGSSGSGGGGGTSGGNGAGMGNVGPGSSLLSSTGPGSGGTSGTTNTIGKKSNMNTFNSLSSKLQRSLNQMVTHNSKSNVDSPSAYVDGLSRLFVRSQVLGDHLTALLEARRASSSSINISDLSSPSRYATGMPMGLPPMETGYSALAEEMSLSIEVRLRRMSEFFANVILRFVLRDVTILVDKSVKRTATLLCE